MCGWWLTVGGLWEAGEQKVRSPKGLEDNVWSGTLILYSVGTGDEPWSTCIWISHVTRCPFFYSCHLPTPHGDMGLQRVAYLLCPWALQSPESPPAPYLQVAGRGVTWSLPYVPKQEAVWSSGKSKLLRLQPGFPSQLHIFRAVCGVDI
jgi:hypothetical protein